MPKFTMKFFVLFFCTLLITSLYFFPSNSFSVTSPSLTVLAGRRSMTEQKLHEQNKVVDKIKDKGKVEFPQDFREQEDLSSDDLETVYHIDYNGVTTHPIPTPKHPRP